LAAAAAAAAGGGGCRCSHVTTSLVALACQLTRFSGQSVVGSHVAVRDFAIAYFHRLLRAVLGVESASNKSNLYRRRKNRFERI